ncbi:MAG: hypothetical protein EKK69_06280 [Candidatus Competibacteraceae bacterium]|jgi:hypothetical protein|nr:MAG: hypothetical protein EKK69_06280 [Candidatus Competibacteraceae bacterium]
MIFKQPVEPMSIEKTGKQRQSELKLLYCNLFEPRFMTKKELLINRVQPDFDAIEYFQKLESDEDIDEEPDEDFIRKHFSDDDTYNCHSYENTVDHIAVKLDRGDAILSISALKFIIDDGIGLVDEDNEIEIICAKNSCIACINQEWIGGDAYSTLFIDFREDTPVFVKAFDELDFGRINAIATLSNGVTVVLLYPGDDEIKILDCDEFVLMDYAEGETLKLAREAFSKIPKAWQLLGS